MRPKQVVPTTDITFYYEANVVDIAVVVIVYVESCRNRIVCIDIINSSFQERMLTFSSLVVILITVRVGT